LTPDFERVTKQLLDIPEGPEPLQYLVWQGRRTARREELEQRFMGDITPEVIYSEAEDAFAALSTLLRNDTYFFGERYHPQGVTESSRPGLLDAGVFAYVWTVFANLGQSDIAKIINKHENIVDHANRLNLLVYT
jgi:hypothetical protein